jgi:hypothetical protein
MRNIDLLGRTSAGFLQRRSVVLGDLASSTPEYLKGECPLFPQARFELTV